MNVVPSTIDGEDTRWIEEKWRIEKIISANISKFVGEKSLEIQDTCEWEMMMHSNTEGMYHLYLFSFCVFI